jgi:DNA-binding LytR/AlgR family response regulator
MVINCLIVDDAPIARDIVKSYCGHFPQLKVIAECGSALEAKAVLEREAIQLLFLDINMPVLSGIGFLGTLKNPPQVIFTTAYKEYATDAFDLAACDYLLKPFSLERFIVAVDRAMERLVPIKKIDDTVSASSGYLFIKTNGQIYKVQHEDLLYAEAGGNNTKVITTERVLHPVMTFAAFEALLPTARFLRIHRSFIVNQSRIGRIQAIGI